MNQLSNKKTLESQGWTCRPCACTGAKSFDCLNKSFAGVKIKIRPSGSFKIYNKGMQIDSGSPIELQQKINEHELNKPAA